MLGTSLGKEVIAEGIETQAQMELLRDLGCGVGQGYHLARPMPAEEIHKLLLGHARDADLLASMPEFMPQPRLFH